MLTLSDVLVVIMNKDNAEGLDKCLDSLTKQTCSVCKDFDILIVDGDSKDSSREVALKYASKYPCIKFLVQRFKGGVGPARIEAIKYAEEHSYKLIIWGDSENVYESDYIEKVVNEAMNNKCEVVSGRPIVPSDSLWSKLFFWYHAMHIIFKVPSFIKIRHAPGNNKCSKLSVYNNVMYPPISRTDDYYFSYLLMRKDQNCKIKFCHRDDAVVKVNVPRTFKEVLAWQRARVKGLLEGSVVTKSLLPPDNIPWILYALAPPIALASLISGYLQYALLIIVPLLGALAYIAYCLIRYGSNVTDMNSKLKILIYGLIGTYLYALLTTYYFIRLSPKILRMRHYLRSQAERILNHFDLKYDLILPWTSGKEVSQRRGLLGMIFKRL